MKAVLVIDMPLSCHDCPLVSEYVCLADERVGNVFEYESYRYPLCPLKEMPQKYMNGEPWYRWYHLTEYEHGWNACIEEIEK